MIIATSVKASPLIMTAPRMGPGGTENLNTRVTCLPSRRGGGGAGGPSPSPPKGPPGRGVHSAGAGDSDDPQRHAQQDRPYPCDQCHEEPGVDPGDLDARRGPGWRLFGP